MVADLDLPVDIIAGAIRRETDGLAMSSRNRYLDDRERELASTLIEVLQDFRDQFVSGYNASSSNADRVKQLIVDCEHDARHKLEACGFDIDYVSLRDATRLVPPDPRSVLPENHLVVLLAAHIGSTRLIDNLQFIVKSQ